MSDIVEELLATILDNPAAAPERSVKTAPRTVAPKVARAEPRPVEAPRAVEPAKKVAPVVERKPLVEKPVARPALPKVEPVPVKPAASAGPGGNGRPAPTPANQVVAPRVQAPKNDYRNIRF